MGRSCTSHNDSGEDKIISDNDNQNLLPWRATSPANDDIIIYYSNLHLKHVNEKPIGTLLLDVKMNREARNYADKLPKINSVVR